MNYQRTKFNWIFPRKMTNDISAIKNLYKNPEGMDIDWTDMKHLLGKHFLMFDSFGRKYDIEGLDILGTSDGVILSMFAEQWDGGYLPQDDYEAAHILLSLEIYRFIKGEYPKKIVFLHFYCDNLVFCDRQEFDRHYIIHEIENSSLLFDFFLQFPEFSAAYLDLCRKNSMFGQCYVPFYLYKCETISRPKSILIPFGVSVKEYLSEYAENSVLSSRVSLWEVDASYSVKNISENSFSLVDVYINRTSDKIHVFMRQNDTENPIYLP